MDRIDIDLGQIDTPFSLLPDGEYTLTIGDAKYQESKNTGRPMARVRFDHPDPEDETQTIFINHYLMLDNRRGLFQLRQLVENAGLKLKDFKGDPSSWDFSGLVGSEIPAVVILEETEDFGKQNRIRSFDYQVVSK